MTSMWTEVQASPITVTVLGVAPGVETERAGRVVGAVVRRHRLREPVAVRLSCAGGPSGSAVVQVNLRVHGRAVRTQTDGPSGFALTLAAGRLDRQIHRVIIGPAAPWWPEPGRPALAYASRHTEIVRRKSFRLPTCTPSDAIGLLDAMDFSAFLFTDITTGTDAIVYWAGPSGARLARQRADRSAADRFDTPLTVDPGACPVMTASQAAALLCRQGLPFLFHSDPHSGRGQLLYRRYDGDLALVTAR
ncbi:sigma 54 modulation/S30EA ribosomal C-terminal domain-containing protein [Nocardia pseudobrasiliensis]|uniref:Sigma 54 modulation/S30EA-like ribosomal protein n=1 Tax=Nocardia pseudobrasiliensis TaxID=45979 RepID=A0A370IBZ0_9NOCA|nr:sigma 54 modulation/S30EA ribosomal C-terminal domain-containing protein [Nocardia pseudobrasiliensis]RDI68255.1 sigma 54 modulation/S30EA-like ribosomal protein [Nocardia pseudobrasiliensis]